MEDVGIAYNINKIKKSLPVTNTVAKPFAVNRLADVIRKECAMAGWVEVLPLILVSLWRFCFSSILQDDADDLPPSSVHMMRTSLGLTGRTLASSQSVSPTLPLKNIKSSEPPSCLVF